MLRPRVPAAAAVTRTGKLREWLAPQGPIRVPGGAVAAAAGGRLSRLSGGLGHYLCWPGEQGDRR